MVAPSNRKRVTNPELRQLFIGRNLDSKICKKLLTYEKPTPLNPLHPIGTVTLGYECYDANGGYIGLVFYYKHPDGQISLPFPKEFLIDGVWHYV